jgi:ribosomal protein L44E
MVMVAVTTYCKYCQTDTDNITNIYLRKHQYADDTLALDNRYARGNTYQAKY